MNKMSSRIRPRIGQDQCSFVKDTEECNIYLQIDIRKCDTNLEGYIPMQECLSFDSIRQ